MQKFRYKIHGNTSVTVTGHDFVIFVLLFSANEGPVEPPPFLDGNTYTDGYEISGGFDEESIKLVISEITTIPVENIGLSQFSHLP